MKLWCVNVKLGKSECLKNNEHEESSMSWPPVNENVEVHRFLYVYMHVTIGIQFENSWNWKLSQ